jgi:hypothetical protein
MKLSTALDALESIRPDSELTERQCSAIRTMHDKLVDIDSQYLYSNFVDMIIDLRSETQSGEHVKLDHRFDPRSISFITSRGKVWRIRHDQIKKSLSSAPSSFSLESSGGTKKKLKQKLLSIIGKINWESTLTDYINWKVEI